MPDRFEDNARLFAQNRFHELSGDSGGRRFLLIRSLSRGEHLRRLFRLAGMEVPEVGARELFRAAFDAEISQEIIERCIRQIFSEDREVRRAEEEQLLNQLYLVQEFNWGLHQSNLEKTIVDNYVKKIKTYDALSRCVENELLATLRSYVICSWYNHWTSIIIEDIFKDHADVLPAVGRTQKIDFFLRSIPFDLKVISSHAGKPPSNARN